MSFSGKNKNRFELEGLEPRVLLSGDTLMMAAFAGASVHAHQPLASVHEEMPAGAGVMQDAIAYQATPEAGNIFEGVSSETIPSTHETAAQSATQKGHRTDQNQTAIKTAAKAEAARNSTETVQSQSASTTVNLTVPATNTATANSANSATSVVNSSSVITHQLTASLKASNAPPVSEAVRQTVSNQLVASNSSSTSGSNSQSVSAFGTLTKTGIADLFQSIQSVLSGSNPASFTLSSATLGGVLSLTNISVTLTMKGGSVSAVSISADSASLTLGGGVSLTTGKVTGNYDIAGKKFSLTLKTVTLAFSTFVNVSADSASLTYDASADTAVNLTDGTTTSTKSVSLLTIGINNATVFAGMNGPSSNSDAVGVELDGANLALALMSASDGTVYYGVEAKAGALKADGLPDGFKLSSSDLQVQINGSNDGNNVVNFDSSFVKGTGLAVATGGDSVNLDYTHKFFQASGTIELDFGGYVSISGSMAIQSQAGTTVTLSDGTTPTMSELTIGADKVTIFAGMNGPSTNSKAVGVELDNAGFALAMFTGTDGKVYYGVKSTAETLKAVGLPDGFEISATDLQVQINGGNDGNNVVNFDAFNPGTGMAVQTGTSPSVNLDYTQKYLQASGTIKLEFGGFVSVSGSMAIQSQAGTTVTLTGGATQTMSELTIGANDVTIFAGMNGPSTNTNAVGVELDKASFALALFTGTTGKVYYGVVANATSLSSVGLPKSIKVGAGDLDVEINGSNDGGTVVNFDAFKPGTGLTVQTGTGTNMALDFTGSLIQVKGTLDLSITDNLNFSGSFSFTKTATEMDINFGHLATFSGAKDLSFSLGPSKDPYFSATAYGSMTITATTFTLNTVSVTVTTPLKIASILEVDTLSATVSDLSIDLATGDLSGVTDSKGVHDPTLTITAASAALFPGSSSITGAISATTGGDGLGFNGTFDLQTGAFSINLEQLHLAIGSGPLFTADAANVLITYNPALSDPHQQLVQIGEGSLDFKIGSSDITGSITNLTIYKDGFHFDSVTIGYTGSVSLGSFLTLTDPSVTLTDFGVTFGTGNTTFTENGSLTVSAGSAKLNVGSLFSASATSLTITIALDPADLGDVTVSAGELSLEFGSMVTFTGTNISINTAPADGQAYLSVGTATASLQIGTLLTLSGSATNFSIINNGGSVQFYEGIPGDGSAKFGVSVSVTPGQLNLPSWLGFQIQNFGIKWKDFANHPDQFQLVLSASITSIQGLPGGVTVSGAISGAVIDTAKLEQGEFPITDLSSISGSISGTMFGMKIDATFVIGFVNLNAANQVINSDGSVTDTATGVTTTTGGDTKSVASIMYIGLSGTAGIPEVGTVSISLAFSDLGPLSLYLGYQSTGPETDLILDPDTGIAISGFSGGVAFGQTMDTPNVATDLPNVLANALTAVGDPGSLTGANLVTWQSNLEKATVKQYVSGQSMVNMFTQPIILMASVSMTDAYADNAIAITGYLVLGINPNAAAPVSVLIAGTNLTMGGYNLFNGSTIPGITGPGAYAYFTTSGTSTNVLFLVNNVPGETSFDFESFGGKLSFNFTDSSGAAWTSSEGTSAIGGFTLSLSGFFKDSALGFDAASISVEGNITLTVTTSRMTLDLSGDVTVGFLGDLGDATGEFVLLYPGSTYTGTSAPTPTTSGFTNTTGSIEIYGALDLYTGSAFDKLATYGLVVDGSALFQVNTTGHNVLVTLPQTPSGTSAMPYVIQGSVIFDMTISGKSSTYATISYEVPGTTVSLFQMEGFFDLRITNDSTNGVGMQMFADIHTLTIGPSTTQLLSFSGFGLFLINSQGLAAEINLTLNSGTNPIPDFSFSANFSLVLNTTAQAVTFDVPSVTVPTSTGSLAVAGITIYNADQSVAGTVTSLVIPAGLPHGSLQIIGGAGAYASSGPVGPYVLITGNGSLTLFHGTSFEVDLNGFFYFQMNYSSGSGFQLELLLNVNGNVGVLGNVAVTGVMEISKAGEVALLNLSGQGGATTDYGSGISLQVNAQLGINTTSLDQSQVGGITFPTISAHSWKVIASGTLTLSVGGTGFVINGVFSIGGGDSGGVTSQTIEASGTLTATVAGSTLLTMQANGVLFISYTTASGSSTAKVYGALVLTVSNGNPLSGNGFSFNGSFLLEVNTTGVAQNNLTDINSNPLTFDGNTVALTAGPGNSTTTSNYVQIYAVGTMTFGTDTNKFVLLADPTAVTPNDSTLGLYLSVSGSGIAVTAGARMSIVAGGTSILSADATGAMLISSSGFAASLTVTTTMTDPGGHYAFNGVFTLQVNTTGVAQTVGSGINISAGPGSSGSPAGPYFQMYVAGTLVLGSTNTNTASGTYTGMYMGGDFYLTASSAGLAVTASSTLYLKVAGANIFTFTANGALLINSSGIAAKISLTIGTGSSGTGFSFGASVTFRLELNTTGSAVTTINNQTVNLAAGPYFKVVASGKLVIGGAVNISGSFTLTVDSSGVEVVVAATINLFGNVFSVSGGAGFYQDGFALGINLKLGGSSSPVVTIIPGVLTLTGTFTLEINTTGSSHTFGSITISGGTTFDVHVSASFNVFGFSLASATFEISEAGGVFWAIGTVGFNFFDFITFTVDFYFDSNGGYWFYGNTGVQVGPNSFNIHGSLTLEFASNSKIGAYDSYSNVYITNNFLLDVNGGVTAFGIKDIISADVNVTITGTSVDMSVWAGVSIDLGLFTIHIGGTVHIHLGTLNTPTPPPPPPLGSVSSGTITVDGQNFSSGTLLVYLGSYADSSRTGVPSEPDETITITEDSNGNIFVSAPGVTGQTEEYTGVSRIVLPNAGTSNEVIQIDPSVKVPVYIFAGSGNNQFYLGGGATTVTGSSGNDTVFGGSGGVTFTAGSGSSVFQGGAANNIINDPGSVSVVENGYISYSLVGTSASNAVLTYSDGSNNYTDTLNGSSITVALTGATSGAQSFSVSNYSGTATLDEAGNSNVTTSITVDSGNLTVSGNTVTESNGTTGTITLQSNGSATYGTLNLDGGSSANTFTINSWSGTGLVTLDGKGGSDTYIVNFQSSGSFAASVADSGSAGDIDSVIINGTTSGKTINVTGSAVSLDSQTVDYSGIENLTVYTKANGETVDVTGTSAATFINTGSYADTINVGTNAMSGNTGGTLNGIATALTVTGGTSSDTLNLDDTGDTAANTGNLSYNSGSNVSTLTGLFGAGGSLNYPNVPTLHLNLGSGGDTLTVQSSSTATTHINGGSGNDTFNIQGMSGTMTVNTGAGTNTVNIGSNMPSANGLAKNIRGTLTITGGGATTMNVDDTGDSAAATGKLTGSAIAGFGMGISGIAYSAIDTLNISLGSGGNTFNVASTNAFTVTTINSGSGNDTVNIQATSGTTNINTGPGVDTVNVGSLEPLTGGIVNNIQGALVITGSGNDTLNVDDTGSSTGKTGTLTSSSLTDMGMGASGIAYSGLAALNVSLGSGNDTFNVQSTYSGTVTTVNTGAGTNTVNIASNAPATGGGVLTGIAGELVVNGQGADTMNLNDTGDPDPGTLTQTTTTLTGLGMGANGIVYSGIETLNINLGAYNNTIYIQGNPSITTENLNTGSGTNIISIGSRAQSSIVTDPATGNATNTGSVLDNVQGIINITGSGTDTLNVDDSGSTTAESGGLWANKLRFLDPVTINFTGIAAINISLSQGNDQFVISNTISSASSAPVVVIDGNGGDDTFVIFDTHAVTTINGGDGEDTFYDFGNSAVLYLNGNAGDDTFYIYASVSANTTNVGPGAADSNGNKIYSYRVNAPVDIDGGSGNDKVFIYATVLNDVITIDGMHVTGAGIDVSFTNIEQLFVAGLGGDDTFYIKSIAVPTTIIGDGSTVLPDVANFLSALGLTLPDLTGGAPAPTSFNDTFYVGWQGASYIPGSLAGMVAPLTIFGDNGPNLDGSTTNTSNSTDTIFVDDSADTKNQSFVLTASMLTGTGFGAGGYVVYDSAVENLNFQLGNGDNTMTVNGTGTATQTSIYGGRGNDTFIVNDDPLFSPLALFGGLNTFAGDTLTVNGAAAGNTFDLTGSAIDGAGASITYEEFEKLTINAGGPTTFNVNGDSIPTYLNGGSGNDIFNVNSNTVALYLTSGAGNDNYVINANSGMLTATGDSGLDAGNDSFTVNGNNGTLTLDAGAGNDSFVINGNGGTLTASGNVGDDTFTVNALSSPATLNGNGGNDSFTVNAPLAAALTVNGGGDSGDWLTINGTTGNDSATVTGRSVSGLGAIVNYSATNLVVNGVSGNDAFLVAGTSSFITRINGGAFGDDTFNVQATTGALYLTGGAIGDNVFNFGSLAPVSGGVLANIAGPVFIAGGTNLQHLMPVHSTGTNIVNVDDSGDAAGVTGDLTESTLTGLGMGAGITFVSVDSMNVYLGSGSDTVNIQSTNATTVTTLDTGAGANVVNVGSNAPGSAGSTDSIQGSLIVRGGGNDTMTVDDTGNATGRTGILTSTTLTGLGLGVSGITYSGLAALNINLGSGSDIFNVLSTYAATVTTLDTGAGTNTINVGSNAPADNGIVGGVQGGLVLIGSGNDKLNVDDTGSVTAQAGTLTATTLTGLGMGTSGITYSGMVVLNINLGSAGDSFTVTGITNSTVTTIDGRGGNNSATLSFGGDFAAQNLTLLNFQTASLFVAGDFSGLLIDQGSLTTVTIGGALTSTGVFSAGAINAMTIGGDLAGLLDVTGLLNTLAIGGGSPGKIIAGSINYITVQAGYGNKVFQVIEGGVERQIQAVPVAGGPLSSSLQFAFCYDSSAPGDPQLALKITNNGTATPHSFNLSLVVINAAAQFNLALALATGETGLSNLVVEGDIQFSATAAELNFLRLPSTARTGVVLPFDNITGVEVSGILPIMMVDVAGIEGFACGLVETPQGNVLNNLSFWRSLGKRDVVWKLLGSSPVIQAATDAFVIPFSEAHSVRLFAQCNSTPSVEYVMTLSDQSNHGMQVIAAVTIVPGTQPTVKSVTIAGDGASVACRYAVGSITSTGTLGNVTVDGAAGLGNLGSITASGIFGNIQVTSGAITGTIQTTGVRIDPVTGDQTQVNSDIGQFTYGLNGKVNGVTSIFAAGGMSSTGQIICRGNLISTVSMRGAFNGLVVVQGNLGAILTNPDGSPVLAKSGKLVRFGGINAGGLANGQIIVLGNTFGDITIKGPLSGRIAVQGAAVTGLNASRTGILGNLQISSGIGANGAVISGGMIGDAAAGTKFTLKKVLGFVAANGSVNLANAHVVPAAQLFANSQSNANGAAIDAVFTDHSMPLLFDTGGSLVGLGYIQADLEAIGIIGGNLAGTTP